MNRLFKKRWIPLLILFIAGIVSCFYIYETALTNKKIITQIEEKQIKSKNKIDSLEIKVDSLEYENMVKDIIILDSISPDDISEYKSK